MPTPKDLIDSSLIELARIWPVVTEETAPGVVETRCGEIPCSQKIFAPDSTGRLSHLMYSHGYRMDGVAYDNNNRVITSATEELQAHVSDG